MRSLRLAISMLLLVGLSTQAPSKPERNWQMAQVQQIQRVPNIRNNGDHWEYVLFSNNLIYTLRNGGADAPYLNASLNSEVKIASTMNGSNHPYDGDEVYVLDVRGQEHKMALVSAVIADAGCKK